MRVRAKIRARSIALPSSSSSSRPPFFSRATEKTVCVTPSAGTALPPMLIVTGSRSSSRVSATIGGGIVAEKNIVCLRPET